MPGVWSMNFGMTFSTCVVSALVLYATRSSMMSCESTLMASGEISALTRRRHMVVALYASPTFHSAMCDRVYS